jgi:glutaredoxin
MAFLYLTWGMYAVGLIYFALQGEWLLALGWLVALPLGLWIYMRVFPKISQYLGYGRVDDVAAEAVERSPAHVTMYGSFGCPFCPIVERRLKDLQKQMGFDLEYIDVTARPDILRSKGIKAVPVVEVDDRRLVGHATTQKLAELVRAGT